MPFNGAGLFTRLFNWVSDYGAGVPITASRVDNDMNDVAAALSNCLTRDGQGKPATDFDLNGFALKNASGIKGPGGVTVASLDAAGNANLSAAVNFAPSVTLPSAATVAIGSAPSNGITISGTAAISSFGTCPAGIIRNISFSGACSLSYNGTSMILPGAQSMTVAPGDCATFVSLGSGNWQCTNYTRAGGRPLMLDVALVASVAALKSLDKTRTASAQTSGYYAAGDGGGGLYYLDVADTTTADNGGTVIVGADGGRWKLVVIDGRVSVNQFGAKQDGATNMKTALQAAVGASGVKEVTFGAGPYYLSGTVTLPGGIALVGIPGANTLITAAGSSTLFLVSSLTSISGLTFNCFSQTAGAIFTLNTAAGAVTYVTIKEITSYYARGVFRDSNASNLATNIRLSNISSRYTQSDGMVFYNVYAFLECRDIEFDHVGNVTAVNAMGYHIENNQGAYFDNCEFTGSYGIVSGTNTGQSAFYFVNSVAIYLHRCFADSAGGYGFYFNNCQYLRFDQSTASLTNGTGVYLNACSDVQICNLYASGRQGQTQYTASIPGVVINGGSQISITNIEVAKHTGNGLTTYAPSKFVMSAGLFHDSAGYGYTTNAGGGTLVTSCVFNGNAQGSYYLSNSSDYLQASVINSGALTNVTGPASA